MNNSAQLDPQKVLVTEAGSLLGFKIAELFIKQGKQVFGTGKVSPPEEIIKNSKFTLLDIDTAQPFPEHIPKFDLIIHLLHESTETLKNFSPESSLTPATNHIVSQAKEGTQLILLAPLETNNNFYEKVASNEQVKENLKLFLMGDIYGPEEPYVEAAKNHPHTFRHHTRHFYYHNELTNLVAQAVAADKVVLEDEGLRNVFPTYIDDALKAIERLRKGDDSKKVKIIVSESPKTALSCAYDIQKIARITIDKEPKLFFSGPERHIEKEPYPLIHLESLGFKPEVKLEEGLKKTFESFREDKKPAIKPSEGNINRIDEIQKRYEEHAQKPKNTAFNKVTSKIPLDKSHFSAKRIILALVLILLLTIAKTGLDLYLATSSLKTAQESLTSGDFTLAQEKSNSASKSFKAAANKIKIILLPVSPVFSTQTRAINDGLTSAYLGAQSLDLFSLGAQDLTENLQTITSNKKGKTSLDIEAVSANFQEAYLKSTQAEKLASLGSNSNIFPKYFGNARVQFKNLSNLSASSTQLVNFLPNFVGQTDKKTYLILIQDNTELRPGGGFIASFGEIVFENGKLGEIKMEDILTIDKELEEKIEPPEQLTEVLEIEQLFLRDSNWSTDFLVNSSTARDFYQKLTGKSVDGVIAIDLTLIENLIEVSNPINVSGEIVSKENLPSLLAKEKDNQLLSSITAQIFKDFTDDIRGSNLHLLESLRILGEALSSKHILASFENKELSALAKTKAWTNSLPPVHFDPVDDSTGARDFFTLSEANLGANKVNRFIERNINYEMTVGKNGSLTAKLKITYKNSSTKDSYNNFLRVYAPFASTLSEYLNGKNDDLEEVEVTQASNLRVFSTFIEVSANQSKTVEFSYKIPKTIKLEKAPSYNLYVSKQPGTEQDPFTFTFILPSNIQIESVNNDPNHKSQETYSLETNLEADRIFEIKVSKK